LTLPPTVDSDCCHFYFCAIWSSNKPFSRGCGVTRADDAVGKAKRSGERGGERHAGRCDPQAPPSLRRCERARFLNARRPSAPTPRASLPATRASPPAGALASMRSMRRPPTPPSPPTVPPTASFATARRTCRRPPPPPAFCRSLYRRMLLRRSPPPRAPCAWPPRPSVRSPASARALATLAGPSFPSPRVVSSPRRGRNSRLPSTSRSHPPPVRFVGGLSASAAPHPPLTPLTSISFSPPPLTFACALFWHRCCRLAPSLLQLVRPLLPPPPPRI
jgi:hypothetical protein